MDKRTFTGRRAGIYKKKTYAKRGQTLMGRRTLAPRPRPYLPLGGFPAQHTVRLKYAELIAINAGVTGAAVTHVFRANGLFDPNFTGTGTQPKGFDQWMGFYNHYTVVGSKIKVTPMFAALGSSTPAAYGVALTAEGNEVSGRLLDDVITMNQGQSWSVHGNFNEIGAYTQERPTKGFSARKFFGKKDIVSSNLYRGNATTNPTEQAFFEIWAAGIGGGDPPALNFMVEIWYTAVLTERVSQPPS